MASDARARLLLTHSLIEGFGRYKGRIGMTGCVLCGVECESVIHV